jgi:hypothetical protein
MVGRCSMSTDIQDVNPAQSRELVEGMKRSLNPSRLESTRRRGPLRRYCLICDRLREGGAEEILARSG